MTNKHIAVVKWEQWCESEEGIECLKGETKGQYLQNRLWRAFMAGWNQCGKVVKETLQND